jgi:uncharacterized radical SAM superfamily Fe-S cluster-containing enzyme
VRKGVNDHEIGDVLRHAAQWRYVRWVNFQPVQDTGRNEGFAPEENWIVLSEIRRAILDQWGVFGEDDMTPCRAILRRSRSATDCATDVPSDR